MENNKKTAAKKRKNFKPLIRPSVRKAIITIAVILVFVVSAGSFFAFKAGVPSMILTGAEFLRTSESGETKVIERIKVNELNFQFSNTLNQLAQYGMIDPDASLDSPIFDTSDKTIRQFAYEYACDSMIRSIQIGSRIKADKEFKPEGVERSIHLSVKQLRETVDMYASIHGYTITADEYLAGIYGPGSTVSNYAKYMERQMIVEEYVHYVQQFSFMPSVEEMDAMTEETAPQAGLVTFHQYLFAADFDADADAEAKDAAIQLTKSKAELLLSKVTDGASFRDRSEEMADEEDAQYFVDGQDPTMVSDISYASLRQYNEELADFLFAQDRAEGDQIVIETESGAIAVYYVSRMLEMDPYITYRELTLNYALDYDAEGNPVPSDKEKVDARANEIILQANNEKGFASLVKKYSENYSNLLSGGLITGVNLSPDDGESPISDYEKELYLWLTSSERKHGDTIVLYDSKAAHLLFFVENIPTWKAGVREAMINDRQSAFMDEINAEGVITYNIKYKNINFAMPN